MVRQGWIWLLANGCSFPHITCLMLQSYYGEKVVRTQERALRAENRPYKFTLTHRLLSPTYVTKSPPAIGPGLWSTLSLKQCVLLEVLIKHRTRWSLQDTFDRGENWGKAKPRHLSSVHGCICSADLGPHA